MSIPPHNISRCISLRGHIHPLGGWLDIIFHYNHGISHMNHKQTTTYHFQMHPRIFKRRHVRPLDSCLHIHHNPPYPCYITHESQANHYISYSIVKLYMIKNILLLYANVILLNRFINWINKATWHKII